MTEGRGSMKSDSRYGKGYAEWIGRGDRGCWFACVSVGGKRERLKLSTPPPERRFLVNKDGDRDLARVLTEQVSAAIRQQAYEQQQARLAARLTVRQFGELWTSGKLYELHGEVRGLKEKKSVDDDRYRLQRHVYPFIGNLAVADVTEQDIERCMAKAAHAAHHRRGKPWRQATRFQLYQVLRRLFDLAVKPGRLRTDNPVSVDSKPRRDSAKLFSFLYPSEFLALVGCERVPLQRRVHYALAAYTGLRKGSLRALRWGSVDFEHGTITSLESKTGLPQIFAQSDPTLPGLKSLLTILKRYHEQQGGPGPHEPIVSALGCRAGREAQALRADLKAANISREMLFSRAVNVEPIRFHDMRASFVTWARRAGKGQGWIADRTGHLTVAMMDRYDRGARTLTDLNYEPFPDLSEAIPELAKDLPNVARLGPRRSVGD